MKPAPLIICVLLVLGIRAACAEDPALPLNEYTATSWSPREGAPQNIMGLAQTPDGTLWIGSSSGLYRFDGVRFRRYGDAPHEGLPSQFVRTLAAPPTGGLWIGFQLGGVAFLEDETLTIYSTREGLPEAAVRRILVDRNSAVWIATAAGLGKLVDGRWQAIDAKWGLPPGPRRHCSRRVPA